MTQTQLLRNHRDNDKLETTRSLPRSFGGLAVRFVTLSCLTAMLFTACSSNPKLATDPCLKRRGAVDVGSGSTKAFAAVVDICQTPKRIVEKIYDEKAKISYGEGLERSTDGNIPADVAADGAAKVATFAEAMSAQNLESIEIVATAAFRKAKNGAAVVKQIGDAVNTRLKATRKFSDGYATARVLTQEQEAEVGARSALVNLPNRPAANEPIVVWDIGGGSMQMWSAPDSVASSPPHLFTGDLASVTFKNQVVRDLQKKDPAKQTSPNPLKSAAKKAVAIAKAHAKSHVPEFFKSIGAKARWVGIGGVLAISVQKQVEKEAESSRHETEFDAKALAHTLDVRAKLKDDEIESDFRATEVTNLALVLGYMEALGISHVETVEASLTQGLVAK